MRGKRNLFIYIIHMHIYAVNINHTEIIAKILGI